MKNQDLDRLQLKTKAFVTDVLAGVNTGESIQNNIRYVMEELGRFTHAEKVYVYEPDTECETVQRVYQWKTTDLFADDSEQQVIQCSEIEGWIQILNQKQLVVIDNKETIRNSMPVEYNFMEKYNIHGLLLLPLFINNRISGGMCMVNPDFSAFEVVEEALLFLGKQIGLLYHRERVNQKYLLFMEGMRSSNLSEFVVSCKTKRYEAFRITRLLRDVIPEEGDWDWLRQFYTSIIKPEYREDALRRTEPEYLQNFLCTEQSTFTIDVEREVEGDSNYWFRLEFSVLSFDEEGHLERFVLIVKDITQMKREEEENQQMIRALSSIYKACAMIDLKNQMTQPIQFSEIAQQYLPNGTVPHQVILDAYCSQMVGEEYEDIVREFMDLNTVEQRLKNTNMISCEYHGKQIGWGRIILAPAKRTPNGNLEKIVMAVQDITEQKRREEWMQYKIEHDELTGTLNRVAFNRVTKLLEETDMPFGFLLLDIDRFKSINDSYGHDVGDEVLIQLVTVLNGKMRTLDKIFRLGGDEFVVIMNQITSQQAPLVKQMIESINETITTGGNGIPAFSISAGVTFSNQGYSEMVYHNADKALYRTKETTRRGCTVFEEMND